jgi:thiamine-phosphate pyrophosphorylase
LCYVTDRKALPGTADEQIHLLLQKIEEVAGAGVDSIQIRERDLPGGMLGKLLREAARRAPPGFPMLVNDRLDVASASGAAGVHLGEQSVPVAEARRFVGERSTARQLRIGVSTHSLEAAIAAERAGADYIIFGPVYATPSKAKFGAPQGVERLGEVCEAVRLPVVAIGGITVRNARECLAAGAAGIAAIRLFQDAQDAGTIVRALRFGG